MYEKSGSRCRFSGCRPQNLSPRGASRKLELQILTSGFRHLCHPLDPNGNTSKAVDGGGHKTVPPKFHVYCVAVKDF